MKVLVGCEQSQEVTKAFRKLGHEAFSCDIIETDGNPNWHYKKDILDLLEEDWDLGIFHPPCTHLAVSGARWFKNKEKQQKEALKFVWLLMNAPINKIAIENPISVISSKIRKPTQIIQPYFFGDPVKKSTCLWLKNLPLLKPTNIIQPEIYTTKTNKKYDKWWYESSKISNLKERSKFRNKTFQGIAKAMAEQWSD